VFLTTCHLCRTDNPLKWY